MGNFQELVVTEAVVKSSTLNPDTTDNLSDANTPNTVNVSSEEYNLLQQLKRERRGYVMQDKAKLHSKIISSRRITVALRRIDLKTIAPVHDVVAYIEICNLKAVGGDKSEASEAEMKAYLDLFYAGNDQPTLDQIKAAAM
jgi:hypothetical protein